MDIFSRFRSMETRLENYLDRGVQDNSKEIVAEIKLLSKQIERLTNHVMTLESSSSTVIHNDSHQVVESDPLDGLIFIEDDDKTYIPEIEIDKRSTSRVSKKQSKVATGDMDDAFDMLDQIGG